MNPAGNGDAAVRRTQLIYASDRGRLCVRPRRAEVHARFGARELECCLRREMAPQRLEKIESAPGNGMASEASDPQDLVRRLTARLGQPSLENDEGPGLGSGKRRL